MLETVFIIFIIIITIVIFRKPGRLESELKQLEKLKLVAERHIKLSEIHISYLLSKSNGSEKNLDPWNTLMEGCDYLKNAHDLVKEYKNNTPASLDTESVQLVNNMLMNLGYTKSIHFINNLLLIFGFKTHPNYYKLLYSEQKKDVKSFITLVEHNIEIPVKKFLESINRRLNFFVFENLLKSIENDNFLEVKCCISREVDVNSKDTNECTPLHHAVSRGNLKIVRILLQKGAKVAECTNKGENALHIACSKGHIEVINVLLDDKSNDFINTRIIFDGKTSLHIAAENSFTEIVKSLLIHGAFYNIEDNEGKTPIQLSNNKEITDLLNLVDKFFNDAEKGNAENVNTARPNDFLAIINARNNQGNTLFEVIEKASVRGEVKNEKDKLKELKGVAMVHLEFSKIYISRLKSMSMPDDSENNYCPWKTLKEGSYFLGNAYRLVETYQKFKPGSIDNEDILKIGNMLKELEFDPKHISSGYTDEAYDGKTKCFVSKGRGTKYYSLLHSDSKRDVRSFIQMVELNIDIPVKRFLKSINQNRDVD